MLAQRPVAPGKASCIALVDGDPTLRRARQLSLLSANYDIRAYPTCAALLADPLAFQSACVVADATMGNDTGRELIAAMRRAGWRGRAILLTDTMLPELADAAMAEGFVAIMPKAVGSRALLYAVKAAVQQGPRAGAP